MVLLGCDMYIHCNRFDERSGVVIDVSWTQLDLVKLLNAFNNILLMENKYKPIGISCLYLKLTSI